jgi:serine/threonine protein kinase
MFDLKLLPSMCLRQNNLPIERHGYIVDSRVGKGSFGEVLLVVRKADGANLVIKKISVMNNATESFVLNEVLLLKELSHPHIVAYHDAFWGADVMHIVMDYAAGGDLGQVIETARREIRMLEVHKVIDWFCHLTIACEYLHSIPVLHRDLKPSNVFLTHTGSVKLGGSLRVRVGVRVMVRVGPFFFFFFPSCSLLLLRFLLFEIQATLGSQSVLSTATKYPRHIMCARLPTCLLKCVMGKSTTTRATCGRWVVSCMSL